MKTDIAIKDKALAERAAKRIIHRQDGSIVIPIHDGLYDLFVGQGFTNHSRFRVIKFNGVKGKERKLYQVSGAHMDREVCDQLLKELH